MKGVGKLTEKEFQAQVVAFARLHGWAVYHTHDSRRSAAGFPDLFLVRRQPLLRGKHFLAAELKVGGRKATPEQLEWLRLLNHAGVPAYLWRETDWPEIESVLGG